MKILIADDDPVSRTLLTQILESAQAGYSILSVDDGTQAWATLEQNLDTKLAILDLQMPGVDGIELLRRARGDSRFAGLPIIVCTATTDRATVTAAAALRVSDFLVKPFTRSVVLDKVINLCKPQAAGLPALKDLTAARQRFEIDRDAHRELLTHYVRVADMWATDARRTTEFPKLRSLAVRAGQLKQTLGALGAAAAAAKFQEAEEVLGAFKVQPVGAELPACLRKATVLGEKIQPEIDRLRETIQTIA